MQYEGDMKTMPSHTKGSRKREQVSRNVPLLRSSITIAGVLGLFFLWTKLAPFLLATYSFGPHGDCFLWNQGLVTLFAGSDSLIGLSYLFISGILVYFVYKMHHDLPFSWVFLAFGIFIIACGSTHFLDVWTIWVPVYVLSGILRFITALASVTTAMALPFVLPHVSTLIATAKVSEERKRQLEQANHELKSQYERDFRHLADVMPQIVWTSQPDGWVDYYNRRWFDYTGLTFEQTQGWGWESIIHPDDIMKSLDTWRHAIETGELYEIEYRYKRASDESYRWHLGRALPMQDTDGHITKWIGISTDINDQKQMALELETKTKELLYQQSRLTATNMALEEANQARSQFLATMSHELRTPLTSIVGFSEMLLEDAVLVGLDQEQQANLERILKNSEHLLNLINDVLDLSKIEAGRMQLSYEQVNVKELVVSVTDEIQSLTIARDLALKVELDEGIDSIETHSTKLRQILMNLLSNALKFTEQGEVKLSVHPVFLNDKGTEGIAFVVQDTGIGMSQETQAHIFEAFYQADMSYTRKVGGTGLGLSILKQLTTLLNGTVEVISILGQGSTFTVKLPLKATHSSNLPRLHSEQQQEVLTISSSSHERVPRPAPEFLEYAASREVTEKQEVVILAVDDNPDTIIFIEAALRDTPYTLVGVHDSLVVMEMVQKLQPEAIILDVMMPRLNGWQLLHLLKDTPVTASIPVVMLSVLPEQAVGYVLGANEYLVKPLKKEELLDVLHRVIESKRYSR